MRWQGRKRERVEVANWEIPCFIQGWETQSESKI